MKTIDQTAINTLRFLAVDAVDKANSGHPGLPLGTAPLMYTIWDRFMNYNPKNPKWFNRDRFVLSPGHGSALLYAMLNLTGYELSLEDLKEFRQWGSKTPGHPEYGVTPGVDASTGPLGHGFAMAVGMALSETMLAERYNKDNFKVVNHNTYGIVSDGDLMEGVSSEAASLAGTMGLGKLIFLYDDNKITIEGETKIAFSEDVEARFKAYNWQVLRIENSEDVDSMENAIKEAQKDTEHPSLIIVRTHIGFGSPKQDSPSAHGEPLGAEALAKTKEKANWPVEKSFYVPEVVNNYFNDKLEDCAQKEADWEALLADYAVTYPDLAAELKARLNNENIVNLNSLEAIFENVEKTSTREASGEVIQFLSKQLPNLVGGSADLGPSNKTVMKDETFFSPLNKAGRNIHFGVREHAMGKIVNGMSLHGGFIPYAATFLVFSDFMRPAMRMAALMEIQSIFILTHDSIALGEDGPTHQPIEQTMSLRLIPGLAVYRPADALETAVAWQAACMNKKNPTAILLSRQKLPVLHEYAENIHKNARKGAYIISPSEKKAEATIIATGSEVELSLNAQKALAKENISVNVVSMLAMDVFDKQTPEYKAAVIPNEIPTVAVEAGCTLGWSKYTKNEDNNIGINTFGASAPGPVLYEQFGFTVENIVKHVKATLK